MELVRIKFLRDKGSAKRGHRGYYEKSVAERLIISGVAEKVTSPKNEVKPKIKDKK